MYTQINDQERESIEIHLNRWESQKEIALVLCRSESTISREIERNSVIKEWKNERVYLAKEAKIKAYQRRWKYKTQSRKINLNTQMKLFIIEQLQRTDMQLSPKVIANMWNSQQVDKKKHITHTSIYSWFESWIWDKYKEYLLYKYKWYKKKKSNLEKVKIKDRISIEQRPEVINERKEKWHFEADLIVSKKWFKWALLTLIDRKTRLSRIYKLKDKSSENIMRIIAKIKEELWIISVTFDNWMEFAYHYKLRDFWIDTYFCNPYSSWEKWSIENLNRIIRRYFPKWTIFDEVSEKQIRSVCNIIANTPREILGFVSPNQAHFSK